MRCIDNCNGFIFFLKNCVFNCSNHSGPVSDLITWLQQHTAQKRKYLHWYYFAEWRVTLLRMKDLARFREVYFQTYCPQSPSLIFSKQSSGLVLFLCLFIHWKQTANQATQKYTFQSWLGPFFWDHLTIGLHWCSIILIKLESPKVCFLCERRTLLFATCQWSIIAPSINQIALRWCLLIEPPSNQTALFSLKMIEGLYLHLRNLWTLMLSNCTCTSPPVGLFVNVNATCIYVQKAYGGTHTDVIYDHPSFLGHGGPTTT